MIRTISIEHAASYDSPAETLTNLSKINFIYGSNGSGKTTISRIIANPKSFSNCELSWQNEIPQATLVYNQDFVKKNFSQNSDLKGIFTLGETSKEITERIKDTKSVLNAIQEQGIKLKHALEGDEVSDGKRENLAKLETDFDDKCWKFKRKYDHFFKEAFQKVRSKKIDFKNRVVFEFKNNHSEILDRDILKEKANIIFGEAPLKVELIPLLDWIELVEIETTPILQKQVIGKEDVDIAGMIRKLNNVDWVRQGRKYYDDNDNICPFCQQKINPIFSRNLSEYFDDAYLQDIGLIKDLQNKYKLLKIEYLDRIDNIIIKPSKFIDTEKLKAKKEQFETQININFQIIEQKLIESSRKFILNPLHDILFKIDSIIESANTQIIKHNKTVDHIYEEKQTLTNHIWKHIVVELNGELIAYNSEKVSLLKAIKSLEEKIAIKRSEYRNKDEELKDLVKNTTSINPTIDGINDILSSFAFVNFSLAKSKNQYYKIIRSDGTDAQETLSEGEKSFITFLYFYYLLKGSENETDMTEDRVVVFDDPVSSLDSNVLFIVSSLIKNIFDEVRSNGLIKQVFILTHNIYFHKEVSFNTRRTDRALNEETFWIVRKLNQSSNIIKYETNPIKTSYELLWSEIRDSDRYSPAIQNTLRRIIENYFKILGGIDTDSLCGHFDGNQKLICKSLVSWINDGSHFASDDLFVANDDSTIEKYLEVFKEIFIKTHHEAHYNMMMNIRLIPKGTT